MARRRKGDRSKCELKKIGGCKGRIDVAHRDHDPWNNEDPANLLSLCRSHHRLYDLGKIDLDDPKMPAFVVRGGKRRYLYRYSAMPRSEACRLREVRKREAKS